LPELEPRVVDQPERAAREFHWHQPAAAGASRRGRRQRHQPAGNRGERLIRRENDRLSLVRHGEAERVLADGQLERRREIVECDELLAVGRDGERKGAAAVFRQQRQGGRRRGLTRERGAERDEDEDRRGREKVQSRARTQWKISAVRGPPLYQPARRL